MMMIIIIIIMMIVIIIRFNFGINLKWKIIMIIIIIIRFNIGINSKWKMIMIKMITNFEMKFIVIFYRLLSHAMECGRSDAGNDSTQNM